MPSFFFDRLDSQTFTSSGSFVVPKNVSWVLVRASGGGGGGGKGGATGTFGGAGGAGALVEDRIAIVTPGETITVTIGAGGGGGTSAAGNPGGDTTFGSYLTFRGGLGGAKGDLGSSINATNANLLTQTVAAHVSYSKLCNFGGPAGVDGMDSQFASSAGTGSNGGGGGASWGAGATGGNSTPSTGGSAAANSGAGGGGGGASGGNEANGGDGGSGKLIVYFQKT